MPSSPPNAPSDSPRSRREMLGDLKAFAQGGALVSTAGLPVVVAIMVMAASGRDLNSAIAILRVADPIRLGLVALVAVALATALLPMFLNLFDAPAFSVEGGSRKQIVLLLVVTAFGLAVVWWTVQLLSQRSVAWFAVWAVVGGFALKSMVTRGSWRSDNNWGLIIAVGAFIAAFSNINPFPQAAVTFPGDSQATVVRIVGESNNGMWYLVAGDESDGSLLRWRAQEPASIIICTKDEQSSCRVDPSPSAGSPSSTPSPSAG